MFPQITIVGLGLMGGSLAASCKKKFPSAKIVAVSRNRAAIHFAKRKRWIDQGTSDLKEGIKSADLIVLCTPVDTFPKLLSSIEKTIDHSALVTDVGSTKSELIRWVEKRKWKHLEFVGAHPMVGSHERGIEAANPNIYERGYTFLIKSSKVKGSNFAKVKTFWKRIMPQVIEVKAREYDEMVAAVSHLPHAVAVCLIQSISKRQMKFASTGFCDTTRVALGDPSIWAPIFRSNRKAILKSLSDFEKTMSLFKKMIQKNTTTRLSAILSEAMSKRKGLCP